MSSQGQRLSPRELLSHERWLRRHALDLVHSAELARDLVQDTWRAYLEHDRPLTGPVRGWLAAVLRNQYRMWCRTSVRRDRRELGSEEPQGRLPPDHELDRERVQRLLLSEVDGLPEPYRSTLRLRYYDGLRPVEIATRLGLPQPTVRRRNMIGLELLRQRLLTHFGDDDRKMEDALARAWLPLPVATGMGGKAALGGRSWLDVWRSPAGLVASAAALTLCLFAASRTIERPTVSALGTSPSPIARAQVMNEAPGFQAPASDQAQVGTPGDDTSPDEQAPMAAPSDCALLQPLIDQAPPGGRVLVPACVHRESVVISKPLLLEGQPGAEIRGSDVVSGFVKDGTVWRSPAPLAAAIEAGLNTLFRDSKALTPARPGHDPGPSEFSVGTDGQITLGADPSGHIIELATRSTWVSIEGAGVTVRGLRMRHARPARNEGGLNLTMTARQAVIDKNVMTDSTGVLMRVAGEGHLIVDNELGASGTQSMLIGVWGDPTVTATVVRGNLVHHGGLRLRAAKGWTTGGIQVMGRGYRFEDNVLANNIGTGLFCAGCKDTRIAGNVVRNNTGAGLIIMKGERDEVIENRLWRNGFGKAPVEPAVFLTESTRVRVARNFLAYHPAGILIDVIVHDELPPGFDTCAASALNTVEDNVVIDPAHRAVSLTGDPRHGAGTDRVPPCPSNLVSHNRVWMRKPARLEPGVVPADGTVVPLSDAERDLALASAGIPSFF